MVIMSTKAVIYARLSVSEKRAIEKREAEKRKGSSESRSTPPVSSLEDQVRHCRKLAEDYDYEVVDVFSDDGISAWSGKIRPSYVQLIERVQEGDIDFILTVADDRLTRDVGDNIMLQTVCVETGAKWHTVSGGVTNPNNADGQLSATIKASIAQYESAVKAERVRRAVERRLNAGDDLGGPRPFGWEPNRRTILEKEAAVLRRAYDEVQAGASLYEVTKTVFEKSQVPPVRAKYWRASSVRAALLAPRHKGHMVVKGVDYGKVCEGIVDEETWEKVFAILTSPSRDHKRGAKDKYFTGIARCGTCGSRMGAGHRQKARCRRKGENEAEGLHSTIKQEILEEEILKAVEAAFIFGFPADFDIKSGSGSEISGLLERRKRIADAQRQTVQDRNDGFLAPQDARDELKRLKTLAETLDVEIDSLRAKSSAAEIFLVASSEVFKAGQKVNLNDAVKTGSEIRAAFLDMAVERQRELLDSLMTVTVLPGMRGKERVKIVHKIATSLNED